MRVYISGAISNRPLDEARQQFIDAADQLKAAGHESVNPFDVPPAHGCSCPGTGDTAGAGGEHAWECYLRGDLVALLGCDAILLLPGWHRSHGARRELSTATTAGITVWWQIPDPVIDDVHAELDRAYAKFPDQHLPDGTGNPYARNAADIARSVTDKALREGNATWRHVLNEEVSEAFAETDSALLRAELVQIAAMTIRWIRDIDLRAAP